MPEKLIDLGIARIQLFNSFIISETNNTFYMIDQHAAHERVNYEKLKKNYDKMTQQKLLISEEITLSDEDLIFIEEITEQLHTLHVIFDIDEHKLKVKSLPSLLRNTSAHEFVADIIAFVKQITDRNAESILDGVLATIACHASIKANQRLSIIEMQALIHDMQITPHMAQCNHGRPTYFKLERGFIDRLFQR